MDYGSELDQNMRFSIVYFRSLIPLKCPCLDQDSRKVSIKVCFKPEGKSGPVLPKSSNSKPFGAVQTYMGHDGESLPHLSHCCILNIDFCLCRV